MTTVTIVFDHYNRVEPGKTGPIDVRLTVNRKVYYISTGVRVRRDQWQFGQVVNHEFAMELTEKVNIVARKVYAYVNDCEAKGKAIVISEVREIANNTKLAESRRTVFLDWVDEQLPLINVKPDTLKHYKTTATRLREFNGILTWDDLTTDNLYKWDAWLHGLDGWNGKKISDGGVWTYHKTLKALLNRALTLGKIDSNPYDRLRGKFKRGDKENVAYLTDEEMKAIMDLKLPEGSELIDARDLFIFQMFTGMSYIDTQNFDINDYKKVKGRWVNNGERIKTGVGYVSELLPPVVEVLKRHEWKVPKIVNQYYNILLKAVGVSAGISTPLHSHLARHTFATWMLRNGSKIENVSRMLGHTNITQTQRYAKVMAESVHDDFERMRRKIQSKSRKP